MKVRIFNNLSEETVCSHAFLRDLDPVPVIDDVDTSILSFIDVYGAPVLDDDDDELDEKHAFDDLADDISFDDEEADVDVPADKPAAPQAEPAAEPAQEASDDGNS